MLDIKDFVSGYYNKSVDNMTLSEFESWKEKNNINEWDYPLEEYRHIASMADIEVQPVRFKTDDHGYDYRFCEIPKDWQNY